MAEKTEQVAEKKRRGKNGYRRVTVTLTEADYEELSRIAADELREPNNLLSFALKERLTGLLSQAKSANPIRTAGVWNAGGSGLGDSQVRRCT